MLSKLSKLSVVLLAGGAIAASDETAKPQYCPKIHVFGSRHTFSEPGYGLAGPVVDLILKAHPGATSEAIDYPAAGRTPEEFAASAQQGVKAVTRQVTSFVRRCPDTQIVLIGYSQGSEIMDDAMCGGPDPTVGISETEPTISSEIGSHVKAMVWMGNPRYTIGAPYNLGTATASGHRSRSGDLSCSPYTDIIQSYCDKGDPFCSDGKKDKDGFNVHASYADAYGEDALEFVNSLLD